MSISHCGENKEDDYLKSGLWQVALFSYSKYSLTISLNLLTIFFSFLFTVIRKNGLANVQGWCTALNGWIAHFQ